MNGCLEVSRNRGLLDVRIRTGERAMLRVALCAGEVVKSTLGVGGRGIGVPAPSSLVIEGACQSRQPLSWRIRNIHK